MSRIRIELPERKIFVLNLPVRITDVNYGNHLGNDSLVAILHEGRMQWLQSLGFTELNIGGDGLIMGDLAVEYKAESFYGDSLTVSLYVNNVASVSFDLLYSVVNQNGRLIAKAKTGMVCYDYVKKKVVAIPEMLKNLLT